MADSDPSLSGFRYESMDWKKYMRFRPAYPQKLYDTVYAHHQANGGAYDSALDIGAGPGIISAEIGKKFKHVTLTDPSAEYVNAAKSYLASAVPDGNFDFVQTKAEDLAPSKLPKDEKVDLVVAGCCMHWTDANIAIPAIASILKPGGTFAAWTYGIRILFDRGENLDEVRDIYYSIWDKMMAHSIARSDKPIIAALAATDHRYDHIPFPTSTWSSVRRIHTNAGAPFCYSSNRPDHFPTLPSQALPSDSVEDFHDDGMLRKDEVDYEYLEGLLWSLMPDLDMKEFAGEELGTLKKALGGKRVGVRWPFVLVLATRKATLILRTTKGPELDRGLRVQDQASQPPDDENRTTITTGVANLHPNDAYYANEHDVPSALSSGASTPMRRLRKRKQRDANKFPAAQLFLLALVRVAEPIALTSIFPYAWKLVLHFHVGQESKASFYAGLLISAFALAESITGMFWGGLSDRVGRKPVLLMGCLGTIASLLVVGFSGSFWMALAGRFLGGALNGNIGVIQTMVAELVQNPKHEPKAYAIMPFVWSVGTIVGPSIGGLFAMPVKTWPDVFSKGGVFDKFPYLLPNLICVGLMLISVVAGYFCLEETHPDMQPWSTASDLAHTHAETPIMPAQAGTTTSAANLTQPDSYGTFNAIYEDDIEEWDLHPDGRSRTPSAHSESSSSNSDRVFTKKIIMLTVALGIFTYHSMTYDHLLPIFFQDERVSPTTILSNVPTGSLAGGLGLSTQRVGLIMSINGLLALLIQALIFPLIVSYLGVWRTFLAVTLGHPVAYTIVPFLVFVPERYLYVAIYGCLFIRNLMAILAYPLLLILIKEAAPKPSSLGRINGLAASTGAACRTLASPIAGALYGLGIGVECTGIAWWCSALVAMVGAAQVFWIAREKGEGEGGEGVHVEGVGGFMDGHGGGKRGRRKSVVRIRVGYGEDSGYNSADEETPMLGRRG
ncbi:unnamed protein product [Zymoseptoria tritici ST99CH_1A5]|nr:unnamed protein product [Zymoseptoria tritici ST99CH_1A5]